MRLVYVLPHPVLSGGNIVIFRHARLLRDLGHRVTILGAGPPPDWTRLDLPYRDHSAVPATELCRALAPQDLVIATYWTTLPLAASLGLGPVAHFCQGYEGHLEHLQPEVPAIEAAYAEPLPTLTVSPHLAELLARRFGRESRVVPPVLDPAFHPRRWRRGPSQAPWIALPGIFEAPVKDVPTGLAAVAELRQAGTLARLLRFSPFPRTDEESALLAADRYLHAVPPEEVARELRDVDLLLLPSREGEGFGLPALEAMASGVPVVASAIPSVEAFAGDAVVRVPPGDAGAFAAAARELLTDARRWRAYRRAGIARARRSLARRVGPRLDAAVRWAAAAGSASASAGPPADQGHGGGRQADPETGEGTG